MIYAIVGAFYIKYDYFVSNKNPKRSFNYKYVMIFEVIVSTNGINFIV